MKKCILMIAVLALSVLSMVSCKKDKVNEGEAEKTIIYATMDGPKSGGEKTYLGPTEDGTTPTFWSEGDQFLVSNGDRNTAFTLVNGAGTSEGRFTGYAPLGESNHVALYPSSMRNISFSNNSVTFDLPAFQYYREPIDSVPTFAEGTCPMVAVGQYDDNVGAWNFAFKNLTGVLKLDLTGNGKVGKIVLKDNGNMALWGKATATASVSDYPTMSVAPKTEASKSNELTLLCPGGVELSNEPSFYFVLPVGALDNGFTVEIYNDTYCFDQAIDFTHVTGHPIQRSTINNMSWTLNQAVDSTGYLPGVFDVGNGKKVHFTKGNVYKSGDDWYFEKNQYDFRTGSGLQACIAGDCGATTPVGDLGLFYWSNKNNDYGVEHSANDILSFVDWSDKFGSQYSTLDRLEFMNLFSTTLNGDSFLDAMIGVRNSDESGGIVGGAIISPKESDFASYGITLAHGCDFRHWPEMEACGAVFLPYCGNALWKKASDDSEYVVFIDNPANTIESFCEPNVGGYYWTSSALGDYPYVFRIKDRNINNMALNYKNGCSVRLVVEVQ